MKIRVLEARGIRNDAIVSVRVGSLHKQAPISTEQAFSFPSIAGHNNKMRIDLLHLVSSSRLNVSGHPDTYSVLFPTKPGQESMALTLAVAPDSPPAQALPLSNSRVDVYDASEADEESPFKQREAKAATARAYLERYQVLTFVQKMLCELLQEQPEDPHRFMADHLLNFLGERRAPNAARGPCPTEALDLDVSFPVSPRSLWSDDVKSQTQEAALLSPSAESSKPQHHPPAEGPQGQPDASKPTDTFETTAAETAAGPCAQPEADLSLVRAEGAENEDRPAEAAAGPFSEQKAGSNLVRGEVSAQEERSTETAAVRGEGAVQEEKPTSEHVSALCPVVGEAKIQDLEMSLDCEAAKAPADGKAQIQDLTISSESEAAKTPADGSAQVQDLPLSIDSEADPALVTPASPTSPMSAEEIKQKIMMVDAQLDFLKDEMFKETGPTTPGSGVVGPGFSSTASTTASALQDTLKQNRELLTKQEELASMNQSLQSENTQLQQAVATFCEGLANLNQRVLTKNPGLFDADGAPLDEASPDQAK